MNYAAVNKETKIVENNIEWDGESYLDPIILDTCNMIAWDETTKGYPVNPGATYDENVKGFIPQKPTDNEDGEWVWNSDDWCWNIVNVFPSTNDQLINFINS